MIENTYFEAGKLSSSALNRVLLSGYITIIFLSTSKESAIAVPFINLDLSYSSAIAVMLFIHACFFYRFIASVNYERELRDRLKENEGEEEIWKMTYPSLWNHQQFAKKLMKRGQPIVLDFFHILLFSIFVTGIPIWAVVKVSILELSVANGAIVLSSLGIFALVFFALIIDRKSDNKQKQADA